jgi:hypothetical protein
MTILIYQIFYNEETKKKILPKFIPLDNTKNSRPDWYEFWVILNYLKKNKLNDHTWYGFLSPKFLLKTGYNSNFILNAIEQHGHSCDVAIFSPGWDQLSYFLNPFEQGNVWHPGLMSASQKFIENYGLDVNLSQLVSDTTSSVFSNYIIGKKNYWIKWKKIAESFFEYCEQSSELQAKTSYGSKEKQIPIKTFIQERFASLLLSTESFKVLTPNQALSYPIFTKLFPDNQITRELLQTCDQMKKEYRNKKDKKYLDIYWSTRKKIAYSGPIF